MAIQFTDFSKAPLLDSPAKNIFEDVLKGYKMSQEPAKMNQEASARDLANQLRKLEVDHKPKQYELDDKHKSLSNAIQSKALEHKDKEYSLNDQFKEAQINKANQPTALKGALAAAFKLRNDLNPEDPNYQKDFNAINNYIAGLGQKNGQVPITQPGEGVKINLPEGKEGYIPGVGKLKNGWQSVKDAQGNDIGVNVPMSDKQVDQWKAKEKFDVIYPFLNDALSEYSGQNSWEKFTKDAQNYNKDDSAKKRVDNYLAAKKLISIGSTTENARIGGHATNVQLRELKKTLDSSEVHNKLEKSSSFLLPAKYAKNSGDIFKQYLDKVENAAKTNIPAYEFRALNPGKNDPSVETNQSAQTAPEVLGTENGITTIRNGNKTFKIPENLVDQYMVEHSSPEFGGQYAQ